MCYLSFNKKKKKLDNQWGSVTKEACNLGGDGVSETGNREEVDSYDKW